MATPATTVTMLPMTERLKTLLSHTLSTAHTEGDDQQLRYLQQHTYVKSEKCIC